MKILFSLQFAFALGLFAQPFSGADAKETSPQSQGKLGSFLVSGSDGLNGKSVEVFYYQASNATADSPVVMVMPGGGRNADDYRDAWKTAAERYDLLILSPRFSEVNYPGPLNYNMGRIIETADRRTLSNMTLRRDSKDWIFRDIDRIFEIAKQRFESSQTHYDFFGHSAGGQIGHRLAIFHPNNRARTILAANSGWYTAVSFHIDFPFGLNNAPIDNATLENVLSQNLVIFLGELDNAAETRGHLRTGAQLDTQGPHRLARGQYFFDTAKQTAEDMALPLNWRLQIIKGVGHSYQEMSEAAADYLYRKASVRN